MSESYPRDSTTYKYDIDVENHRPGCIDEEESSNEEMETETFDRSEFVGFDDVEISSVTVSKSFRLFSPERVRAIVESVERGGCKIYRKGDSNEYHILCNGISLVTVVEDGTATVVTQMHQHPSYKTDEMYIPEENK